MDSIRQEAKQTSINNRKVKKKTVFFYAVDPGALAVMSLIVETSPHGFMSFWVAEGYAENTLASKNITTLSIENLFTLNHPFSLSDSLFVLGSQCNFERTVDILNRIRKKKIKTVFIFDHWSNYTKHFTSSDKSLVLPDKIFVPDELCKKNLISAGISGEYIRIVGHPSIERTITTYTRLEEKRREEIRKKMGIKSTEKLVLLALEPKKDDNKDGEVGYDEYSTTLSMVEVIKGMRRSDIRLMVRLHPRQSKDEFNCFLKMNKVNSFITYCPDDVSIVESISAADVVIGMTSVFLLHARAVGKPTLSLQLNCNPCGLSGSIPHLEAFVISNPARLAEKFSEKLCVKKEPAFHLNGGVEKVWQELGKMFR